MKGKMAKTQEAKTYSAMTYIRCDLDATLKAELASWVKSKKHDWFGYIEQSILDGLRFGTHVDSFNHCIEARLTLLSNSVGVDTLVLQGRGPDMQMAIQSLFYKHFVVLEKDWEHLDRLEPKGSGDWS
jgi:hypothetical protein